MLIWATTHKPKNAALQGQQPWASIARADTVALWDDISASCNTLTELNRAKTELPPAFCL